MKKIKSLSHCCLLVIMACTAPLQAIEDDNSAEPVLIPVYNPNTDKIEYKVCGQYPACEQEGDKPPVADPDGNQ